MTAKSSKSCVKLTLSYNGNIHRKELLALFVDFSVFLFFLFYDNTRQYSTLNFDYPPVWANFKKIIYLHDETAELMKVTFNIYIKCPPTLISIISPTGTTNGSFFLCSKMIPTNRQCKQRLEGKLLSILCSIIHIVFVFVEIKR